MLMLKDKLMQVPTPAAGLALGIASIGKLLDIYAVEQNISVFIASTLLLLVLFKFLMVPKVLFQELSHPVLGSIIPTFAMTTMIISTQLPSDMTNQAIALWYVAVGLHLSLLVIFTLLQLRKFALEKVLPSWFIPPVGLAVAALTCPGNGTAYIAEALLYFAIAMYFLLLPLMLFRLILLPIADAVKPTIAILAAPPNLCLAAYLSFVETPSTALVLVLIGFALLMTALVYMSLFVLIRLPFSPAFAGFTFPLVISATAIFKACVFLETLPGGDVSRQVLQNVATVELYIACAIVAYVFIRYLRFFRLLPSPSLFWSK